MNKPINQSITAALSCDMLKFKKIITKELNARVGALLQDKRKEVYKQVFSGKK